MNLTKKSKIEWALGVLGLTRPVREADVIDAMNTITQSWEDNLRPEAWEAKRKAQEAGAILFKMIEEAELAKAAEETGDPLLYYVSEEAAKKARESEQKRRKKFFLAGGLVLALILAFAIPSAITNRRERMIESVFILRSTLDSSTVPMLEKFLNRLEGEPRVEAVRAEYDQIKDDIEIWLNLDFSHTPSERRDAYYRLLSFDEARPAWYLMGLLDLQGSYIPLIQDSRFEGEGMYFEFTYDSEEAWNLDTNLPASYDMSKPYRLEVTGNGRDYRLVHEQSELDVVQLYRIQNVTQTELTIYAYSTGRTYVLTRIGS